jgi:hypothetical protein
MRLVPTYAVLVWVLLALACADKAWACGSSHAGHARDHEESPPSSQNLRKLRHRGGKPKRIVECATASPNRTEVRSSMAAVADFYRQADAGAGFRRQAGPIVVDVNFVVVTKTLVGSNGAPYEYGDVSQERLDLQIGLLNAAFSPEFNFRLINVQRVSNESYFTFQPRWPGETSEEEFELKAQYRRGGREILNVYSLEPDDADGDPDTAILGFAYFPYPYLNRRIEDGVCIHHQTLPNGTMFPNKNGKVSGTVYSFGWSTRSRVHVNSSAYILAHPSRKFRRFLLVQPDACS